MDLVTLKSQKLTAPVESFWIAINLWLTKPHVVNRRLMGCTCLYIARVTAVGEADTLAVIEDVENMKIPLIENTSGFEDEIKKLKTIHISSVTDLDYMNSSNDGLYIALTLLLPKTEHFQPQQQIAILDKNNNTAAFIRPFHISIVNAIPHFTYGFKYVDNIFDLWILNFANAQTKAAMWLLEKVLIKVTKWTEEAETFGESVAGSLSLVSVHNYCALYQQLKKKYSTNIIRIWPENTDPLKFVYEDVAIATYLILLWRENTDPNKNRKTNFIDLGCGNGLLVHILSEEGYIGRGIDIRSRKIWSLYPETTKLEVAVITPSDECLFPEADWIIGNHSDELTPWIPVIAARSSPTCRYFVLPCCTYEFNGKKYQRVDSSRSQYEEYLDYINEISTICGFDTHKDKLRIPSTKRICLVGLNRTNTPDLNLQIKSLIDRRCNVLSSKTGPWARNFEARSSVPAVRNCTKIDKNLINEVVRVVTSKLLETVTYTRSEFGENWNSGGVLTMKEVVELIPSETRKILKKEFGGLQTLLKNHHYIFKVIQGKVQFRVPQIQLEESLHAKKTQCWFQSHHPQGCPLKSDDCRYKHT